jgi:hypothetical protein
MRDEPKTAAPASNPEPVSRGDEPKIGAPAPGLGPGPRGDEPKTGAPDIRSARILPAPGSEEYQRLLKEVQAFLERGAEHVQLGSPSGEWTDTGFPETPIPPLPGEPGPPWTEPMPGDDEIDAWLDERPPPLER